MQNTNQMPVIDLFAGPGGLGEGFARANWPGESPFRVALSVECDEHAHRTLLLRSFTRQFPRGEIPGCYFQYLRGELDSAELRRLQPSEWSAAENIACRAELGVVPAAEIDQRIRRAIRGQEDRWILVGGPPCQAYSLIGRARKGKRSNAKDKRHFLYQEYLRILRQHMPPLFVMENVKGLLSAKVKKDRIVERIVSDLQDSGYRLHALQPGEQQRLIDEREWDPADSMVKCERLGIPQARHRLIFVGVRTGVNVHGKLELRDSNYCPTVRDALRGLPPLRSALSRRQGTDSGLAWAGTIRSVLNERVLASISAAAGGRKTADCIRATLTRLCEGKGIGGRFLRCRAVPADARSELHLWLQSPELMGACNHEARSHIGPDLARYLFAACHAHVHGMSPVLHEFPKELVPNHRNALGNSDGHVDFADRFRVQVNDRPSTTVVAHIAKDGHYFIHPDPAQCRSLTVREAARLQTFPDDYLFEGPRTEQYRQVGNAVPPLLAKQIAETIFHGVFANAANAGKHGRPHQQGTSQLEHVSYQGA